MTEKEYDKQMLKWGAIACVVVALLMSLPEFMWLDKHTGEVPPWLVRFLMSLVASPIFVLVLACFGALIGCAKVWDENPATRDIFKD